MNQRPSCDLCGLPVPNPPVTRTFSGKTFRFCCTGCRQVFRMISEMADSTEPEDFRNTDLFKQCRALGIIPSSPDSIWNEKIPRDTGVSEDLANQTGTRLDHSLPLTLKLTDMWCPACAWLIETVLKNQPGIGSARCHFETDRLWVNYDPIMASPKDIVSCIEKLGYQAVVPGEVEEKLQFRRMFIRLMICLVLTANIMMLSFSVYSGFFTDLSKESVWFIGWPMCLMAGGVLVYGGRPIYRKAFSGFKSLAFGMETLITMGAFTTFLYSLINLMAGSFHLYFDTASMLITLTLLGKTLEKKVKDRVHGDMDAFYSLQTGKARLFSKAFPNGRYVYLEGVCEGDILGVEPEETVPADGVVSLGTGLVDESMLTGEPRPVKKRPGDLLTGGTRVLEGELQFTVTAKGKTSCLGRMIEIMETGAMKKSSVEQYAERMLRGFVPAILLLAFGTGFFGVFLGLGMEESVIRAVTVMVIACPCALGIAIPLVRVAGISIAGKKGILVRNFEAFENIKTIDTLVFDKTGTVTSGSWELIKIAPAMGYTESMLVQIALGLEKDSDHGIAFAITAICCPKQNIPG